MIKSGKIRLFSLGICHGEEIYIFINHILPRLHQFGEWEVHGFEAHKEQFDNISKKYGSHPRIQFYNKAISDKNSHVKLYHADDPHGHSIYKGKRNIISEDNFQVVESIKFSDWLSSFEGLDESFNILNFNIEGAEIDLFRDLDSSDSFKHFDLFCGDAHDLVKCKETVGTVNEFESICNWNKIETKPFNLKSVDFTYNRIMDKLCE